MKEFKMVNTEDIKILRDLGIKNVDQMIAECSTPTQRKSLSRKTGIPKQEILRLAQLAELTKIGYIKSTLAPLYHAAGIINAKILASYSAEGLQSHFRDFIQTHNYPAQVPFVKDLKNNIINAKKFTTQITI
ncbi:MAG: DUF4332 domain-containing protein [Candidatus Heimdallarchaeota archaeon]|nr:DUF4332 domain-containing protein [Candidatus Heimdallarchaeota archaeon]